MIYDATTARQLKPLPRCGVVYEFAHRNPDGSEGHGLYSPSGDRSIEPTVERIAYAAKPLLNDPDDACHLLVLDDESRNTNNLWSNTAHLTEANLEANRDKLMRLGQRARLALPGQRVGMYGIATPGYAHTEGYKETEVERFASRLGYDRLTDGTFGPVGVIEYLDFVCPVAYVRVGESFDTWQRRCAKMIDFCRRWQRQIVMFHNPCRASAHTEAVEWFDESLDWIKEQAGVDVAIWSAKPLDDEHKQAILGRHALADRNSEVGE